MTKLLFTLFYAVFLLFLPGILCAQTSQTVVNGSSTTPINFGTSGCSYNWVNNTPSIGLAASGTGNIASFTAINNGSSPVTATITGVPSSQGYAYIANDADGSLSIISTLTNTVVSTITPPHDPFSVCISPDGTKAYIGCGGGPATVSVINISTNTIISTIPVEPAIAEATGLAVSPDGSLLYVEDYQTSLISVVNLTTNTVVATIAAGGQNPYGIAVSHDGSKVYIGYSFANYVSVINTATNNITSTITVGSTPSDVKVSPDGSKVYVAVSSLSHLAVIDPVTNTVKATIPTGPNPGPMTITPDGTRAYILVSGNGVSVINLVTGTIIGTVTVGSESISICVSPDGKFVYVTNGEPNTVSVINTSTNTVIATVNVGNRPVSAGNFVTAGPGCPITPIISTITINPSVTIIAGNASGSINTCFGTASANPNIQQFTVSGSNLAQNITAIAPAGFELSLNNISGYGNSVTLNQNGGTVNTIIYVRSAANAPVGNISGNVTLSSTGATTQSVLVNGTINPIATINTVASQTVTDKTRTVAVNFTGTAITYSWINDTPGIGLATSGTGDIPSFIAINNTNKDIIATITVSPLNSTNCNGAPIQFNITVNPTPIFIAPALSIPNTFTPNGDGINDTWVIKNSEYYPTSTINIFDRWGQKLYSSIGYPTPWDGKFKGKALAAGSYYYLIDPKNGQAPIAGWLAIIR